MHVTLQISKMTPKEIARRKRPIELGPSNVTRLRWLSDRQCQGPHGHLSEPVPRVHPLIGFLKFAMSCVCVLQILAKNTGLSIYVSLPNWHLEAFHRLAANTIQTLWSLSFQDLKTLHSPSLRRKATLAEVAKIELSPATVPCHIPK